MTPAGVAGRSLPRIARFGAVGVANTLLDLAVFTALVQGLGWPVLQSNVISYGCGVVCSFALNSRWTFAETAGERGLLLRFLRFLGASLFALLLSTLLVVLLARVMDPLMAKLVSVAVGFLTNYGLARAFVFRSAR